MIERHERAAWAALVPPVLALAIWAAPAVALMVIGLIFIYAGCAAPFLAAQLGGKVFGDFATLAAFTGGVFTATTPIQAGFILLAFGGMVAGVTRAVRRQVMMSSTIQNVGKCVTCLRPYAGVFIY
jgi:hypothetical protein